MSKVKYYYDKKTLSYKKISLSLKERFKKTILYSISIFTISISSLVLFYFFFDSPKEKKLKSFWK